MNKALATIKLHKLVILIICFALTSVLIYRKPSSKAVNKRVPLSQALANIKDWTVSGYTPLGPKIVKALELDDYANHSYSNGNEVISLYIGYYLSTKKVGAAHSPLVCFPGQGWVVSDTEIKSLTVGEYNLNLATMIIGKGQKKELILYWYQAFDRTSPGTLLQKVHLLLAKFLHSREDNAFVRVSVPVHNQDVEKAFSEGISFIKSFYPIFLAYVKGGD